MIHTYDKTSLGELLLILRRNILESVKKEGFKYDLTFSQVEVIRYIEPTGRTTMREIADFLKITPPSATEIVAEMEKKGLVKRKSDKSDRRVVSIVLSDKAKRLFISSLKHKDIMLNKMISKLSKKDRASLERIIKILITD